VAAAAVVAAAATTAAAAAAQAAALHWSPSLVFLPAAGLVAGRAIKVLTTIKVSNISE
jgi:hypothetical protein